jgi:DNA repair exonuclease SbcCD ATPase subunit
MTSLTSSKHSKSGLHQKPRARKLLQFSSPLMNTFSNYMQRANIQNLKDSEPLKQKVTEMTQTIEEAKQKGMKKFLAKKTKKKSLRKKKKIGNPFLNDIKKYIGDDSATQEDRVAKVNAPIATSQNSIVISQDNNNETRELEDDNSREVQSPSHVSDEVSLASDPSKMDNREELKKEQDLIEKEEKSLQSKEDELKDEEMKLKNEKDTISKAEQELQMEETQFNNSKNQEYQKMTQFNQDIANKEQYLSTQNQQLEQKQHSVDQRLAELQKKIHLVEAKEHEFEKKLQELQTQKDQISQEREELNKEHQEIMHSKEISDNELKTAQSEQKNIDHENEDLQNRVQEVKAMRGQLNDLKNAYSVAFHKVVVHENQLKNREKMLQIAEDQVAQQKADLAQKLIQFKNEYAILRSREVAVNVRMGDIVHKEDAFKSKKTKRKLQGSPSDVTKDLVKEDLEIQKEQMTYPNIQQPSLTQNNSFMKQLPSEISSLSKNGVPMMPQIPVMSGQLNKQIPNMPPMSAYNNMPMPSFQDFSSPNRKIFGGDSMGSNHMIFQPSKNLVNMMDRPKFLDDPYMKKKNFFKDDKLLI